MLSLLAAADLGNAAAPAVSAITSLQLNAGAIAPEGAVLLAMLACLLVDLAGERAAARWVPVFSYAGLPHQEAARNMRLFAGTVMPELKKFDTGGAVDRARQYWARCSTAQTPWTRPCSRWWRRRWRSSSSRPRSCRRVVPRASIR